MFNYIVKKTIKNYKNVEDVNVREKYGTLCSVISIICNMFMVCFKLIFGYLTHSVALQADGLNNLSDMGSNIATFLGFKLSLKHADSDHPYGHGRYEYIMGLIISFLVLSVAFSSLKDSLIKVIHPEVLVFKWSAVIALIVSILLKLWMASFNLKTSELIQSTSLKAAAQDSKNDALMTLSTLIVLLLSLVTDFPLDGIIGTIVSCFVLKAGVDIFKDTVDPLLGQAPDKQLVDNIFEYVMSFQKVVGVHDFIMHDYGPGRKYLTFHAEVNKDDDIMAVHDEIDLIERGILQRFKVLTTIHMDPIDNSDEHTIYLREKVRFIVYEYHHDYSIHDFRCVVGATHTNLIFDILIPSYDTTKHSIIRQNIQELISKELGHQYFCVIQVDHSFID